MSPSTRVKRLQSKLKKKQLTTQRSGASSKRTQSRASRQDPSIGTINSDPKKLRPSERDAAVQSLNSDIDSAKNLPPAEAGILLRAVQFLRQVLLELDNQNSDAENRNGQAQQESDTDAAVLKKAVDDFNKAKEKVKDAISDAGTGEAASRAAAQVARKKPEDLTADDLREAIAEVEKAIEDGKVLLPADASLLQRALYALRMALFELGGVDPQLAVKDKAELEKLIDAKSDASGVAPIAKHHLTKAIDEVKRAQQQVQNKLDETPESPDLAKALANPEAMTTTEIRRSVEAIDQHIKQAQGLLPEEASLFLRFAYLLKLALLNLAGLRREFIPDEKIALDQDFRQAASDYKRVAGFAPKVVMP